MGLQRGALPEAADGLFLADGGGAEWDALRSLEGRAALRRHLLGLLELAEALAAGFILDAPVYQCRGIPLPAHEAEAIDRTAIAFAAELREAAALSRPVLLQATLSGFPDWGAEWRIVGDEAERLAVRQLGWLADGGIDLVAGPAFGSVAPAAGFIEAARGAGLPVAVTLAIDPHGRLADGQALGEAVEAIDDLTGAGVAWFAVHCADPAHLLAALDGSEGWARRIRGLQVEQPAPDPAGLRRRYAELANRAPWVGIAGLAGGRGLGHAMAMARARREQAAVGV